jgi:hypothetical protein
MDVLSGTKSDHLSALQARDSGTNHGSDFAPAIGDKPWGWCGFRRSRGGKVEVKYSRPHDGYARKDRLYFEDNKNSY